MADFRRLTLNIVAVQATIGLKRHYAVVYLGDDEKGNNYFRIYLNNQAVGSIMWNRQLKKFGNVRFTLHARNQNYEDTYVFPNEVREKLSRKLTSGSLFRMVKIS